MNNVDITNIKKELAKRKAANYEWKEGGEMSKDDIILRTTQELNDLVKNHENAKKNAISDKVHKLVDAIFEKYADETDNMIPLSCAYRPEYRLYGETGIEVYSSVSLGEEDGYNENKHIHAIGRNWYEEDNRWEDYSEDLAKLVDETAKAKVPFAEEEFEDDGESLNEYWYGIVAITRDYNIVRFIMRDDGLPEDDNKAPYCIMKV